MSSSGCNRSFNRIRILGVCSSMAILLHGLTLAAIPWLPSKAHPASTAKAGIAIELAPAPPQQSQQLAEVPPQPRLSALPEQPLPAATPDSAHKKIKPAKPQKAALSHTAQRRQQSRTSVPTAKTDLQESVVQQTSPATLSTRYSNPKPAYPELARKRGQEGTVRLLVSVNEQGQVDEITITQSSGWPMLDAAALKTVRRWRFVPAMRTGIPITDKVIVPVRFALK